MKRDQLAVPIGAFAAAFLLLGAWAAFETSSFSNTLADFGAENDHLVHDFGAASFAIGFGLLLSVRLPHWRTPVLTVAAVWNGLHLVAHVVDLGDAGSRFLAIAEVTLLVVATGVLVALARVSRGN